MDLEQTFSKPSPASRRGFLVASGAAVGLATVSLPSIASAASGDASSLLTPQGEFTTPANLQATPDDTQVLLSWSAVTGASSYQIQYRQGSSGPYLLGGNTDGTSLAVTGLTNGVSYEFVVVATDGVSNTSNLSSPVNATPALQVPGVPLGLSASPGNSSFTAEWLTPASGGAVATYDLRYSTDGSTWTTVTGIEGFSNTVTGLTNGQEYQVQVRAVNSAGSSSWSASDLVTPVASTSTGIANIEPQPPVLSALTAVSSATVFTDFNSAEAFRYYYSTDGGSNYTEVSGLAGSTTSFDISGLTANSYTIKVQKRTSNGVTVQGTSTLTMVRRSLNYTPGQVYTITNGSGDTRPTEVKLTLVGGGGGVGGNDGSATGGNPSQPGQVVATTTWGSGVAITLAAGSGGNSGTTGSGGSGGSNAFSASQYKGGWGAGDGPYGASGGGGGGGAASVVKFAGTVTYVAGGAGGGGGAESRQNGAAGSGSSTGGGGSGTNGDDGFVYTGSTDDAAGGGGGGGGAVGGNEGFNTRISSFTEGCGFMCSRTVYVYASTASNRGTNLASTGTVATNGFATGRGNSSAGYVTVEYLETTSLVQI